MASRSGLQGKYLDLKREENGETYVMRYLVVLITLFLLIECYKLSTRPVSPGFTQPQSKSVAFYLYYWCVCKK